MGLAFSGHLHLKGRGSLPASCRLTSECGRPWVTGPMKLEALGAVAPGLQPWVTGPMQLLQGLPLWRGEKHSRCSAGRGMQKMCVARELRAQGGGAPQPVNKGPEKSGWGGRDSLAGSLQSQSDALFTVLVTLGALNWKQLNSSPAGWL